MTGLPPLPLPFADFDLEAYAQAKMTEAAWQMSIIKQAHACGWLAVHFKPSKVGDHYLTQVLGDAGSPDLLLARNGVLLLIEVKAQRGRLSPEQERWRDAIGPQQWRCWRPSYKRAAWEELA